METLVRNTVFIVEACCSCGMQFAMTQDFRQRRYDDGGEFFCPSGHRQLFMKSAVTRLKEELAAAQRQQAHAEEVAATRLKNVERLHNEIRTRKGVATKLKKRISGGVCPCCTRTFSQLARHMKCKHPDYSQPEEK